jgi:PAS domain S-box-containing protein
MAEKPTYEELEQRVKALEKECARLRRAGDEWQKNEKLYRTLVESLQGGVWMIDKDARTSFVNPSMAKMLGYGVEEMQGRPLFDFMDEEGIQNAEELLRRRQEGASEQHDFEFVRKDGKRLFAIVVTVPILDKQGNYDGALAGIIDVTKHKQMEEALERAYKEWEEALNALSEWISLVDLDCNVLRTNPMAEAFTGMPWADTVGRNCCELVHGSKKPRADCPLLKMCQTGQRETLEFELPDKNQWLLAVVEPVTDEVGNIVAAVHVLRDITERKRVEEALQRSEKLHKEAQRVAHIGHWELDPDIGTPVWSEEIFRIFGLDPGKGPPSFTEHETYVHPEDWPTLDRAVRKAGAEGTPFDLIFRILKPGGEIGWMRAIGTTSMDHGGKVAKVFGTAQDVTALWRAEEALKTSEARLKEAQRIAKIGSWSWDIASDRAEWSDQVYDIFKAPRKEQPSSAFAKAFVHPDDLKLWQKTIQQAIKKQEPFAFDYRAVRSDGETIWVRNETTTEYDKQGRFTGYNGTVQDITDRKKVEQEIRMGEEQLRLITENIPGLVSYVDRTGYYRFVNKQYEEWFGCPREEIVGKHHEYFLGKDIVKKIERYVEETLSGQQIRYEERLPYKSGGARWVDARYVPHIDEHGNVKGFFALVMDITERHHLIEEICQQNREIAILNDVTALVNSTLNLDDILKRALDKVLRITGVESGSIYVFDQQTEKLLLATYRGVSKAFAQQVRTFRMGESLIGRVAQSGEPIVANDITKDSRVTTSLVSELGIHSFAAIPITSKEALQGVLCLGTRRPHVFVDEEIRLCTSIANQVGLAAENATLYRQAKEAEQALRRNERLLSEATRCANVGAWEVDLAKGTCLLSDQFLRIHGLSEHSLSLERLMSLCHPEDRDRVTRALDEAMTGKGPYDIEHRIVRADTGDVRWVQANGSVLCDNNGKAIMMYGSSLDVTQRKEMERAVRESELRCRTLVGQIPAVTYTAAVDDAGTILFVSPQIQEIIGFSPAQWADNPDIWRQHLYPEDRDRVLEECARARKVGRGFSLEYRMMTRAGHVVWFRDEAVVVRDHAGEPVCVQGVMVDITERKRAEEALNRKNAELGAILAAIPDAVIFADLNRNITWVNPGFTHLYGYEPEEALGKKTRMLYAHERDFIEQGEIRFSPNARGTNKAYEMAYRKKNGEVFLSESVGTPVRTEKGEVMGLMALVRDISERKRTEEALTASEEKYKTLAENSLTGVFIHQDRKYVFLNKRFAEIHGYTFEELLGKDPLSLIHPEDRPAARERLERRLEQDGLDEQYQIRRLKKDGTTLWCEMMAARVSYQGIPAIMGNMIDITDRKKTEEALMTSREDLRNLSMYLQHAREQERTSIARAIHDDLGQSLTALKMDLAWSKKRLRKDQGVLRDKMHAMTELVDETISTVKRISSELRPGVLDDLGLTAAVEWMAEGFQERTGIECELIFESEEMVLNHERSTALFRILQEALTNVTRHAEASHVRVSLEEKEAHVNLEIRDDGKGIRPDKFEDSESFGLMGMRERALALGGDLLVRRVPGRGKGTIVRVRIPKE